MKEKQYLINWLEIENFGAFSHKQRVNFRKPVTLYVGPNGSGKSTLINSLMLMLGVDSVLGKKFPQITERIVNKNKKAIFSAELNNPLISKNIRLFSKLDVNNENKKEKLIITRKIRAFQNKKGNYTYESTWYINGKRKSFKEIKELWEEAEAKSVVILPTSDFSFIREHSVNMLINMKGHEKFRAIIDLSQDLGKAFQYVEEAYRNLEVLEEELTRKRKELALVKKEFQQLERIKNRYEKLEQLRKKLEDIKEEEKWSRYHQYVENMQRIEKLIQETYSKINELTENKQTIQQEIKNIILEIQEIEQQINIIKNDEAIIREQISNEQTKLSAEQNVLRGITQSLKNYLKSLNETEKQIKELEKENKPLSEYEQIEIEERLDNLRIEIATLKQDILSFKHEIFELKQKESELAKKETELRKTITKLTEEKKRIEKDIETLKKELASITETQIMFNQENNYSTLELHGSLKKRYEDTVNLVKIAKKRGLKSPKIVFKHVFVRKDKERFWPVVNWILHNLALNVVCFDSIERDILTEIRREYGYEVVIGYDSKPAIKDTVPNKFKDLIIGRVKEFVKITDPEVRKYVDFLLEKLIIKPVKGSTIEHLRKTIRSDLYAQTEKVVEEYTLYYSRSIPINTISPIIEIENLDSGTDSSFMLQLNIEDKIQVLEQKKNQLLNNMIALGDKYRIINEKRTSILKQIQTMNENLQNKQSLLRQKQADFKRLKTILENTRQLNPEVEVILQNKQNELMLLKQTISVYEKKKQGSEKKIISLRDSIRRKNQQLTEIINQRQILAEQLRENRKKQHDLEKKLEEINRALEELLSKQAIQLKEKEAFQVKVNEISAYLKRPSIFEKKEKCRPINEVVADRINIEEEIKLINIVEEQLKRYQLIKEKVQNLEKTVKNAEKLVSNAEKDLKERKKTWISAVKQTIDQLHYYANLILHPFFSLKLELINIDQPKKTRLLLKYLTQKDFEEGRTEHRDLSAASGGEEVVCSYSLFFAAALTQKNPQAIYVIDEFGQQLDEIYKQMCVKMLDNTVRIISNKSTKVKPQFFVATPSLFRIKLPDNVDEKHMLIVWMEDIKHQ